MTIERNAKRRWRTNLSDSEAVFTYLDSNCYNSKHREDTPSRLPSYRRLLATHAHVLLAVLLMKQAPGKGLELPSLATL